MEKEQELDQFYEESLLGKLGARATSGSQSNHRTSQLEPLTRRAHLKSDLSHRMGQEDLSKNVDNSLS